MPSKPRSPQFTTARSWRPSSGDAARRELRGVGAGAGREHPARAAVRDVAAVRSGGARRRGSLRWRRRRDAGRRRCGCRPSRRRSKACCLRSQPDAAGVSAGDVASGRSEWAAAQPVPLLRADLLPRPEWRGDGSERRGGAHVCGEQPGARARLRAGRCRLPRLLGGHHAPRRHRRHRLLPALRPPPTDTPAEGAPAAANPNPSPSPNPSPTSSPYPSPNPRRARCRCRPRCTRARAGCRRRAACAARTSRRT